MAGGFDPTKIIYITGPESSVASRAVVVVQADCPSGTRVIAGGHAVGVGKAAASTSAGNPVTWSVVVFNDSPVTIPANAYAICVAP